MMMTKMKSRPYPRSRQSRRLWRPVDMIGLEKGFIWMSIEVRDKRTHLDAVDLTTGSLVLGFSSGVDLKYVTSNGFSRSGWSVRD